MRTILLNADTPLPPPCVATIGFFDGVHLGHQHLIGQVCRVARLSGMQSMAITFDRHPRQVLHADYVPQLLSTTDDKLQLLALTPIDTVALLHFTPDMAALTAQEFMLGVLKERLNVRKLVIGYDNRFGHNRAEGFDDYASYGQAMGMDVLRADALELQGRNVSSSLVRRLLLDGDVEQARQCLGRTYTIGGRVASGHQEGRKMGFPTANIDPATVAQMLPAEGAYAVKVRLDGSAETLQGMMNIGRRPTFGGTEVTLETNIFGFCGDIYGRAVTIGFVHRLRSERKFASPEQLAEQLEKDRKEAIRQLENDKQ